MDFAQLHNLFIPEGEVKKIKTNGTLVWEKYTNKGLTEITNTSLPDGTSWSTNSNITYSGSLAYTGATMKAVSSLPVTWSTSNLPSGLSINSSTGVISGTIAKNASSDYTNSVTITATTEKNSLSRVLSLKVYKYEGPTAITTTSLANFRTTASYSANIACSTVTWSMSEQPSGLSINSSTGAISGTPPDSVVDVTATNKTYTLAISASCKIGNVTAKVSKSLSLLVYAYPTFPSTSVSAGMDNWHKSTGYSYYVTSTFTHFCSGNSHSRVSRNPDNNAIDESNSTGTGVTVYKNKRK